MGRSAAVSLPGAHYVATFAGVVLNDRCFGHRAAAGDVSASLASDALKSMPGARASVLVAWLCEGSGMRSDLGRWEDGSKCRRHGVRREGLMSQLGVCGEGGPRLLGDLGRRPWSVV